METVAHTSLQELRELEAAPKTHFRLVFDRILSFLPLLAVMAAVLQYKLVPNFKNTRVYSTTEHYAIFLWVVVLTLGLYFVLSLFNKWVYARLLAASPLYLAVALICYLWDLLTLKTGMLPLPYFPWPDKIITAIVEDRRLLLDCIRHSLTLLFAGYFAGTAAGLITGIGAGLNRTVHYWITPVIRFLGPIPSTTWLPIILILATSLFGGSVFLIALGVWYPVAMTSMNGVLTIPRAHFETARTMGVGKVRLIFAVAMPAIMPHVFQGLTQGMSIACTTLMVAEMMGVESGLGWYINWQRGWAEFAKMYGAVIVICLTFMLVNAALTLIKKRVLRWQEP